MWARQWLIDFAGQLEEGKSYILEAVFKDCTIVLEYPLDSLFLLAIFDVNGSEIVALAEKRSIAHALRVPLAPCVFGTIDTFRSPKYLASEEGWVIEALDEQGAWVREKLISPDWNVKSRAIHRMNPTTVWRFCGEKLGVSSLFCETPFDLELLVRELPPRYRSEWKLMADQFCSAFDATFNEDQFHGRALDSIEPCRVCGCSSEFDAHGDRKCFCDPCRNAGCSGTYNGQNLHAFMAIRPDPSSTMQVPGYEAPAFLLNNIAIGWVRPDVVSSAARPLVRQLNEDTTCYIIEFLCTLEVTSFRTLSRSADEYIRNFFTAHFETLHHKKKIIMHSAEGESAEDNSDEDNSNNQDNSDEEGQPLYRRFYSNDRFGSFDEGSLELITHGMCDVCGCSSRFDASGDRICFCDPCRYGCRRLRRWRR